MIDKTNELDETTREPGKIKDVWCKVIPISGSTSTIPNTDIELSTVTHKIRCRKLSVKEPSKDMFFKDKENNKYEVQYFQRDFKENKFIEFMTKIIYE
nr:head-tail adaptor protein [Clostridium sporogenes]